MTAASVGERNARSERNERGECNARGECHEPSERNKCGAVVDQTRAFAPRPGNDAMPPAT